jgi:hypothetical protein
MDRYIMGVDVQAIINATQDMIGGGAQYVEIHRISALYVHVDGKGERLPMPYT